MKNIYAFVALALVIGIGVYLLLAREVGPRDEIVIGVIAPLSGQYAFLGESERNAMLLAEAELESQGIPVTLIFEDDKYDAKVGVSAYEKLSNIDQVDAVVVVSAPVIGALRPLVAEDRMLMLTLGESLFHEDDTVFQLMPAGDLVGPRLGEEAGKRFTRIAVVYSQSGALWQEWKDDFMSGVGPGTEVEAFAFPANSDLRTETQKVLAYAPGATTVFLPLEDGIAYLRNLKTYGASQDVAVICDANLEFSIGSYTKELGTELFEGCISVTLPDTKSEAFVTTYRERYEAEPVLTADYAYDAVAILGKLAAKDKDQWARALASGFSYDGASGTVTFNEVGTRSAAAEVHQYRNGTFVKVP